MTARRFGITLTAIVATLLAAPQAAAGYTSFFVFGDSISDSGNNALAIGTAPAQVVTGNTYVPVQPYASGTYSNGPVWATHVAASLGVPLFPSLAGGTNFAYGGSVTGGTSGFPFDLRDQVQQFLAVNGGFIAPNALYAVAGGGNNARAALAAIGAGGDFATIAALTAAAFATDVGAIVDQLQGTGPVDIVVWNAPNLGLTPAVQAGGPALAGAATALATVMNGALATRLAGETRVTTFDSFGFSSMIAASPGAFGFSNVGTACGSVPGADCSTYLWWDGIHPTATAHSLLAQGVLGVVPVPEPATYALMLAGLCALVWRAHHRRAARRPN